MRYKIYFANAGTAQTGLSPVWASLKKVSDNTDYVPQPAISEIGGGWYKTADVTFTEPVVGVVDGTGTLTSPSDRYVPFDATDKDAYLDEPISTVGGQATSILASLGATSGNLDATISSRLATSGYTAPDNANIGNIWTRVNADLDATISSRFAPSAYTAPDNANIGLIESALAATSGNLNATISSRLATSAYTIPDNSDISSIWVRVRDNLDDKVTTRLATSGYTAPDNANIATIKNTTDNIYALQLTEETHSSGRLIIPQSMVLPAPSGTFVYSIDFFLYSTSGTLIDPDSAPTLHAVDASGTNFDSYLGSTTLTCAGVGHYSTNISLPWTISPSGELTSTQIVFTASWASLAVNYSVTETTFLLEESHLNFAQSDRDKITATYNKLPTDNIADETNALNRYNLLSNQISNIPSVASRVVMSLPSSIARPVSGDYMIRIDVLLYDNAGNLMNSRDSDAGATSAVSAYNGFGMEVSDEQGNFFTCYKDMSGTPLDTITVCHHTGASVPPQIIVHESTGVYFFWINVPSSATLGTYGFTMAWFDKGQAEPGFTIADHKKEFRQMLVSDMTSIASIKAQTDKLLFDGSSYVKSVEQNKTGFALIPAYNPALSAASQASVNAIPTNPLLTTDSRIDATISSRLATSAYMAPDNSDVVLIKSSVASTSGYLDASINAIKTKTDSFLDTTVSSRLATSGYTAPDNADILLIKSTVNTNLDATVSSRLATSAYTTPSNADITAIRTKTDTYLDATISSRLATSGFWTATEMGNIRDALGVTGTKIAGAGGLLQAVNVTTLAINADTIALVAALATLQNDINTIKAQILDIHDEALGKWVLDPTTNTLTIYRLDNTILKIFDMSFTGRQAPAYDTKVPR